jgi:hypothetical protein
MNTAGSSCSLARGYTTPVSKSVASGSVLLPIAGCAQEVVRRYLETILEAVFHPDSHGYRPGKSAIDAVRQARQRCWRYDWVLHLDVKGWQRWRRLTMAAAASVWLPILVTLSGGDPPALTSTSCCLAGPADFTPHSEAGWPVSAQYRVAARARPNSLHCLAKIWFRSSAMRATWWIVPNASAGIPQAPAARDVSHLRPRVSDSCRCAKSGPAGLKIERPFAALGRRSHIL